ncbi:MAG: hypothetical protein Q9227_000529 [Pyrenula ochraceoflavens]
MFFLPSNILQRLVKHGLSRYGIIDDKDLDFTALDFSLGRSSTFELKDVNLKRERLAELLKLPNSVEIVFARVRSLRLSVDLNKGIDAVVSTEISGVESRIRIRDAETEAGRSSRRDSARQRYSETLSHHRRPRSLSGAYRREGQIGNNADPVPSTQDLAESFVRSEPARERIELQEVISQSLEQSDLASQYGEEEVGIGVDDGASLPTFLAGYLKGLGDRAQIVLRDVSLYIELPGSSESPHKTTRSSRLTGEAILRISEISKQGVSAATERTEAKEMTFRLKGLSVALLTGIDDSSEPARDRKVSIKSDHEEKLLPTFSDPTQEASSSLEGMDVSSEIPFAASILSSTERQPEESFSASENMSARHLSTSASSSKLMDEAQQSLPGTPSPVPEDLTASKIFTHEEAESMYMSAMSARDEINQTSPDMPGAWNTYSAVGQRESQTPALETLERPVVRSFDVREAQSLQRTETARDLNSEKATDLPQLSAAEEESGSGSDASAILSPAKEIMTIDDISLCLPISRKGASSGPNTPPIIPQDSFAQGDDFGVESKPDDSEKAPIRLEVSNVAFFLDLSCSRLVISAATKIDSALTLEKTSSGRSNVAESSYSTPFSVSIKSLDLGYYENAPAFSTDRSSSVCENPADDALFCLRTTDLKGRFSNSPEGEAMDLNIYKFTIFYGPKKLLWLDDSQRLRESIRDLRTGSKNDIRITAKTAKGQTTVDVVALPVHFAMELPKIDEFLSRSGGLSTLLDLGSSFSSLGGEKPQRMREQRPRGVHFEPTTTAKSSTEPQESRMKINLRFQGLTIIISGSEATFRAQTSAIKIVRRQEQVRLQIDKVHLDGPYLQHQNTKPAIDIGVENLRIDYLQAPSKDDLDHFIAILTPSKNRYEDDNEIMLDTLLRQRRKGALLRTSISRVHGSLTSLNKMQHLTLLASEMNGLTRVAKYFPDDDRPGILSLVQIETTELEAQCPGRVGIVSLNIQTLELVHVSLPSLVAMTLAHFEAHRNSRDELVGGVIHANMFKLPMLMCRFISDEMEPTVKVKLYNLRLEYSVSTLMDILGLQGSMTDEDIAADLTQSLIGLDAGNGPSKVRKTHETPTESLSSSSHADTWTNHFRFMVSLTDCAIGLNPRGIPSKAAILFTEAKLSGSLANERDTSLDLNVGRASILVIDDAARLHRDQEIEQSSQNLHQSTLSLLMNAGFVSVGLISSASAAVKITKDKGLEQVLDIEIKDDLLVLESTADSTQTLLSIFNGLRPPMPVNKVAQYRTEVMPIEDMLSSLTGDAFVSEPGPEEGLRASTAALSEMHSEVDEVNAEEMDYVSEFYQPDSENEDFMAGFSAHGLSDTPVASLRNSSPRLRLSPSTDSISDATTSSLEFREDHFQKDAAVGGTAHRWDSRANTYGISRTTRGEQYPLKVRIRDVHVIWNLFDGYDWKTTRDQITKAVQDVENHAQAKQSHGSSRLSPTREEKEEQDTVIGDCLFNSIYIGIPPNRDPRELANDINKDIDDLASETGSYATTTTITPSSTRQQTKTGFRRKKLKLNRSRHHKITFELKGINADFLLFPDLSKETQSSVDVRIRELDVFDHVPTSTWKKFATYMRDDGEREDGTDMVHLEILNVKPVSDLAATEIVLKVSVLPLRLHVDQDALDFMSRFFEFKDDSVTETATQTSPPFLQRVEVNPVKVKLDFKPKRVDYGGLRSGRTTEFMNFFTLDQADLVLRRVILYGVPGFDRLGIMLNNIWMPDVKRNQLPGVLAGLAPARSLVNLGGGVKDLVVVPMREYQKDGRIVRSVKKGALSFAKTTTTELVKLGAKLALGTQTVLQNTETLFGQPKGSMTADNWDDVGSDEEVRRTVSLYADQPVGIVQGVRGAYASLERDLLLAKDAIVAVPGEVMESSSAKGAARAVMKHAPTVILRPAIGTSKAIGQTLLGAGNTLDKANFRRAEEKYKHH